MPSKVHPQVPNSQARQLLLPLAPARADDPLIPDELSGLIRAVIAAHAPGFALSGVRVSSRMRRTLGSFIPSQREIRLNARLIALGSDSEVRSVILHELAHAIAHHRSSRAPSHGRLFRDVCREIGARPSKYVDVATRFWSDKTQFRVRCASCRRDVIRRRRVASARCACGALVAPRRWTVVVQSRTGELLALGTTAPPGRRRRFWQRGR